MPTGLLDTSVVIDLRRLATDTDTVLPAVSLVAAVTLAEVVQGPLFARTPGERRARERLVLDALTAFPDPLPFDAGCVTAYRSIAAATVASGRQSRRRTVDLLIAATAYANDLPLFTRNPGDVEHLSELMAIIRV